ncbi:MAG: bile acid:sodium symporter family protein [Steroidobacteraceae bacterium]
MDRLLAALRPDSFTLMIVGTIALATFLPATGDAAAWLDVAVKGGVMTLFFLHGARLPREAVLQAVGHWRLQFLILALTFVLFPLAALLAAPLISRLIEPGLYLGLIFLCCLPSTVQSSIAFTAIGGGNVPAAACAAAASNLIGIVVTPLLTGLLLARQAGIPLGAAGAIVMLLLVPFVAGQLARPCIGGWVGRRRQLLAVVDRGAILLMIYSAFGKAVTGGFWQRVSTADLLIVTLLCALLLALAVGVAVQASRRLRFDRADEVAIVLCGSMKSLVTGMPIANVLFHGAQAGLLVIPLIVFHQVQLISCVLLARQYGRDAVAPDSRPQ